MVDRLRNSIRCKIHKYSGFTLFKFSCAGSIESAIAIFFSFTGEAITYLRTCSSIPLKKTGRKYFLTLSLLSMFVSPSYLEPFHLDIYRNRYLRDNFKYEILLKKQFSMEVTVNRKASSISQDAKNITYSKLITVVRPFLRYLVKINIISKRAQRTEYFVVFHLSQT